MRGSQEPRIRIEPERASTAGKDAAILMAEYGSTLDPWQELVVNSWMGKDAEGNYTTATAGLSVPRQNGKNKCLEAREFYGLVIDGEKILPEKKRVNRSKSTVKELTLDTGLIECGFTFGNRFRGFFEEQTGVKPFKFNVDMVASAKAVKETGDESFTLGDLLDIYYGKRTYAKYDKSALQWNKFVKDFCGDDATKIYDERLKAAASLWKIVRDSDMKKEYSHELFEKYKDSITS